MSTSRRDRSRVLRRMAVAGVIFGTLLATQGAIVRATGAGLGCPDWPLCHNALTPPPGNVLALIEYLHRIVAGIGGLVILSAGLAAIGLAPRRRSVQGLGLAVVLLLGVQVILGGVTVITELPPWVVTVHLITATVLIGTLTALALAASPDRRGAPADQRLTVLTGLGAAGVLVLIAAGGYASSSGAGAVCPEWPLCRGQLLPLNEPSEQAAVHMIHRLIAAGAAYLVFHVAMALWRRRTRYPLAARFGVIALTLVTAQVGLGALNALTGVTPAVTAIHSFVAQWVWISALAAFVALRLKGRSDPAHAAPMAAAPARGGLARDLVALTKPRIALELLITTVAAMVVAARGLPAATVVAGTVIGGGLAAAAAAVFNGIYDRDIDRIMQRTHDRPLPAERVGPRTAIGWGALLFAAAIAILWIGVSWVAAALAAGAFAIYVFVYTVGLKRHSTQNIVIGGAAGAIPPMVGWVAGAGSLDLAAVVLFSIVFVWTPPHFWALALLRKRDYARAGIPMLPVVRGEAVARRHIFIYSLVLVGTTLTLAPINQMGWVYAIAAVGLGAVFVRRAWQVLQARTLPAAERLFKYSVTYLTFLFAAMVVDVLIGPGI